MYSVALATEVSRRKWGKGLGGAVSGWQGKWQHLQTETVCVCGVRTQGSGPEQLKERWTF